MRPSSQPLSRRGFLKRTAFAAGAASLGARAQDAAELLGAEDAQSPVARPQTDQPQIRVLLHEADGQPLAAERAETLHARDLANDPLPQAIARAPGRARITLPNEPVQLSARLNVPGFGEVYCYADNGGRGYTKPDNVEFVVEAATTRLSRVRDAFEVVQRAGVLRDPVFERHLDAASRRIPSQSGAAQLTAAFAALAEGLHAGERLALNAARHRISKLATPRHGFLFGGLASGWQRGPEFAQRFTAAFNFATISWYTWAASPDPVDKRIDYARKDQSLQACADHGLVPKGFGYVYHARGATPEWIWSWTYDQLLPEYRRIVAQTTRRYAGWLPYVEVINEAHDKANLFRLNHAQLLELTREACRAAREGSPTVKRLINHCCLWAEYAKRANDDGTRRWSPFRYLSDCVDAGVEFEVVGLQLYYPQHDLFEIERMLDRFKAFKRPMHITELACNSASGLDAASMRPNSVVPGWHGAWSEATQADWAEGIYTLCYSKPEFEAVGWWDLADYGGHFWPFGGLLRGDFTPKESYRRLLQLQQRWSVGKPDAKPDNP